MAEIVKADGSIEQFDPQRLENSLRRSGAGVHTAARIRETIEASLPATVQSGEVYRRAFQMLRADGRAAAVRYSLRRALFEFGPSGHPFEDFVGELFKKEGWEVQSRRLIQGKCVPHEVDVYATRGKETLAAELKYHNDPGYKTDVKVALYVKARFDDIWQCDPKVAGTCPVDRGYLVTNTKFTSQAIDYAECSGISLLGWSYPYKNSLFDRIVASGLYPVTALTTLRKSEKRLMIEQNISTSELLKQRRDALRDIAVSPERIGAIMAEIETLQQLPVSE